MVSPFKKKSVFCFFSACPLPVVSQRWERRADHQSQVSGGERGGLRADDPHPPLRRQRGPLLSSRDLRAHDRHDLQHGRSPGHLLETSYWNQIVTLCGDSSHIHPTCGPITAFYVQDRMAPRNPSQRLRQETQQTVLSKDLVSWSICTHRRHEHTPRSARFTCKYTQTQTVCMLTRAQTQCKYSSPHTTRLSKGTYECFFFLML